MLYEWELNNSKEGEGKIKTDRNNKHLVEEKGRKDECVKKEF